MSDKVTLVDIKNQQQIVAELRYKKQQADAEYARLTQLKTMPFWFKTRPSMRSKTANES